MAIIGVSGYSGSGKDTIGIIIQYLQCRNTGKLSLEELIKNYLQHAWWLEEQSGWEIKKWAGKLKTIASLLTGIPVEKFEDQEFKKTYLGPEWNYWTISIIDNSKLLMQHGRFTSKEEAEKFIPYLKQTYGEFRMDYTVSMQQMTVRQFLQEIGTDGLRNGLHVNTWVNALFADYKEDYIGTGSEGEDIYDYPNWVITDTRFENEAQAIKDKGGIIIRVNRPGIEAINAHPSETGLDNWNFDHIITNDGTLGTLTMRVHNVLKREKLIHV